MINVVQKNLYNLILIFFALLISLLFYNDQVAVRGGLVISNIITYEDNISPIKYYFLNSWTLLTQLTAIFLKSGLSVKIVSLILVFFLSLIFFWALIQYLLRSFMSSKLQLYCLKKIGAGKFPINGN